MKFRERLIQENIRLTPDNSIITGIDNETFPFSKNIFFERTDVSKIAFEEYKRCLYIYEKKLKPTLGYEELRFGTNEYNSLLKKYFDTQSEIFKKEFEHRDQLQEIAEEIIREIYNVDHGLKMNPIIGRPEDFGFPSESDPQQEKQVRDEISEERKREIEKHIQKRILLNTIAQGSSIYIWTSCYHLAKDKVEAIDKNLFALYEEYTSIVSILLWMFPIKFMNDSIDNNQAINQGFCFVGDKINKDKEHEEQEFDDELEKEYQEYLKNNQEDELYGNAVGINFPVLLHELNKVVFESLISHSVPDELSDAELMYYFQQADDYKFEVWQYFMGPTIWKNLLDFKNENNLEVSDLFHTFSRMEYLDLSYFLINLLKDKEEALIIYNQF